MNAMGFAFGPIQRFRLPAVRRAVRDLQYICEHIIQRGEQYLSPNLFKVSESSWETCICRIACREGRWRGSPNPSLNFYLYLL
jgi:hypothetical protein